MRIGFDAKRAFFNRSGLGNYSRDTISILSEFFPMNEHILYSPKPSKSVYFCKAQNQCIQGPQKFLHKKFSSFWRSYALTKQLAEDKIQLYHGLSNELPYKIEQTGIPSIVTIHDLIFLRFPGLYKPIDRRIYEKKFSYAARAASRVIAVSKQTASDLELFFGIPQDKIDVVYQGCNPIFWEQKSETEKAEIAMKYLIPERFMLYVGTIEERKNLLNIVKAMHQRKIDFPLVVVGKVTEYIGVVKAYIESNKIPNVFFLQGVPTEDLPALYQMAELFVYPSIFEGFGIPILEAITSKTPVITSMGGCFAEAGGKSTIYIDPENPGEMGEAMHNVLKNSSLRDSMIIDGYVYAQQFRQDKIAQNIMNVYEKVV